MARPKIEDEFTLFESWLKESRGLAHSSARSYASAVRATENRLVQNGKLSKIGVEAFFVSKYHENPYTCAHLRTSWYAYAEYQAEMDENPVPLPAATRIGVTPEQTMPLPDELRDHVRTLRELHMTYQAMSDLCWEEVNLAEMNNKEHCAIKDKRKAYEYWRIPSKILQAFYEWSQPGTYLGGPVIARRPGSEQSYPTYKLAKEAKRYTEKQIAEMMEKEDLQTGPAQTAAVPLVRMDEFKEKPLEEELIDPESLPDPLAVFRTGSQ